MYRHDRCLHAVDNTRGGGVLVAVRCNIRSVLVDVDEASEVVFLIIKASNTNFLLAVAYIQSGANVVAFNCFFDKLEAVRQSYPSHEVIICGDFNIWHVSWSNALLSFLPLEKKLYFINSYICYTCFQLNITYTRLIKVGYA